MATEKLALIVTGDSKQAVKALNDVGKTADAQLGKSEKRGKSWAASLKSSFDTVGVGAAIGGAALVKFGLDAVNAFEESRKVSAQTEAVLISTGGAANVTAKQVSGLANEISRKTGIDDAAIQSGENLLLTFTNVRNEAGKGNDVFNQATRVVTDLSVALGQDMKSSAIQVGKALNDPVKGLTALQRVGVTFSTQQKEQIKTLVASGKTLEAQKIILAELTKEFGGSAEAQATATGKMAVSLQNLQEAAGSLIGSQVAAWATGIGAAANAANDKTNNFGRGLKAVLTLGGSEIKGPIQDYFNGTQSSASGAEKAVQDYGAAQKKVADLIADGKKGSDEYKQAVKDLNKAQSATQAVTKGLASAQEDAADSAEEAAKKTKQLASETSFAGAQAALATGGVLTLAQAYLILGSSAGQAASSSFDNLFAAATSQYDANVKAADAADAYNESLKETASASGGAGGATENLTAAFYEHEQKLTAVRDAQQAVGDSTVELGRAQRDARVAFKELGDAADEYNRVVNGVGRGNKTQKDAKRDRDQARDDAVRAGLAVADAEKDLAKARKSGGFREQREAELDLREARRRLTEATEDAHEAQRQYAGTVNGFPKSSNEAKEAQQKLTGAYDSAYDSLKNVREATDSAKDAATALARASDDLAGKLDNIKTGGSRAEVGKLTDKIKEQKRAGLELAESMGAAVAEASGSAIKGVRTTIGVLKSLTDSNPLLRGAFDSVLAQLDKQLATLLFLSQQPTNPGIPVFGRNTPGGSQRFRAKGGPVTGGEPYVVGEEGPELFVPKQSGTIIPNGARSRATAVGGGGNVYVTAHIVNPTGDGRQIADQFITAVSNGYGKKRLQDALAS